jgi:hypothetical protein
MTASMIPWCFCAAAFTAFAFFTIVSFGARE